MAESRLRAFFKPYLRTVYAAHTSGAALGGRDIHEEIWFVSIAGIRAWAAGQALPTREAVAQLVTASIWPESFRRNYGLFATQDVARLLRCRVLVLGCGGLGGHVAELLAQRMRGRDLDRFELQGDEFHARVLAGFRTMAAADPDRWIVVDGIGPPDRVAAAILAAVRSRWGA